MGRPRVKELTERELEVMQSICAWGETTVADVREEMVRGGRELAYTTVATLVKILQDKGFIEQTNSERPFRFRPLRSYEDVSRSMLSDLLERVFGGSREELMMRLLEQKKLSAKERASIESILRGAKP